MKEIKRALLIQLAPYIAGVAGVLLLLAVVAATVAEIESLVQRDAEHHNAVHEEETWDFFNPVEEFNITGRYNGDSYTLNFHFQTWAIRGINFRLPGESGNCTATVNMPIRSRNKVVQGATAWAIKIANDDSFHYGKGDTAHRGGCYFCGTNKKKKGSAAKWQKTYCCNPYVFSAFAHGGGDPDMLDMCKKGDNAKTWIYTDGEHFKKMNKPEKAALQEGDVLVYNNGQHYALYIGGDKVAHAANEDDEVQGSSSWKSSLSVQSLSDWLWNGTSYICRYIGSGEIEGGGDGNDATKSATLEIKYTAADDTITFTGSLDGVDIAGSFKKSDGSVDGRGEYGEGASADGAGKISNPYGNKSFLIMDLACCNRTHPIYGDTRFHHGWDLAVSGTGAPIYSVCDGTVVHAGPVSGFGNYTVIVKSKTGNLYVLYGHMKSMKVTNGQAVSSGTQVGTQGSEGNSTGPHLHLEFRKGSQNGLSTANLKGIQPMLKRYASNYAGMRVYFNNIER